MISKWLWRGMVLVWLIFFTLVMVNGTFSRVIGDDYCTLAIGMESNAWEGLSYWYNSWSGRYSEFFLKTLIAPLQPQLLQVLPALLVITLGASIAFAFDQLFHVLKLQANRLLLPTATGMMLFALLNSVPDVQLLYWFTAIIPYSIPLILLTLMTGLLFWSIREASAPHHQRLLMIILPILAFITGGFTEVTATFQVTYWIIIGLGVILFLPNHRRQLLPLIVMLIIGSVIALITLLIAPGNEIRQSRVLELQENPERIAITDVILGTINTTISYYFITYNIVHNAYVLLLTVVGIIAWIPADTIKNLPRLSYPLRWTVGLIIVASTLTASTVFPNIFATSGVVERILFLSRYMQLLLAMCIGVIVSIYLVQNNTLVSIRRRPIYRITTYTLLMMGILVPIVGIFFHGGLYIRFSAYAPEWDVRNQFIIESVKQGQTTIDIPLLSYYMEEAFISEKVEEAGMSFGQCMLDYYGAESITVIADYSIEGTSNE